MTNIDQIRIERGGKLLRVLNIKPTRWMRVKLAWYRFLVKLKLREQYVPDTFFFDDPITIREPMNQDQVGQPGFGSLRIEAISDKSEPTRLTLVGRTFEAQNQDGTLNPHTMVYGVKVEEKTDDDNSK